MIVYKFLLAYYVWTTTVRIDEVVCSMKNFQNSLKRKTFYEGKREADDRIDLNVTVRAYKTERQHKIKEIRYPPKRAYGHKITYIEVEDKSGCDGKVSVIEGGAGFHRMKIRLKSGENKGLNYAVRVYTTGPRKSKNAPKTTTLMDSVAIGQVHYYFDDEIDYDEN